MPCYERFIAIQKRAMTPLAVFMFSRLGRKTGIYYIDSTSLPVCHNKRINRHKTFAGMTERGKTSMGGGVQGSACEAGGITPEGGFSASSCILHLVFNHAHKIVATRLTPGNVADSAPVETLTAALKGKLLSDKGYIGRKLVERPMQRGLALTTCVRKNMKVIPMPMAGKMLLNKRDMAETIIGHIKELSSLDIPKHRSPINALRHIMATVRAYQINLLSAQSDITITT